MISPEEIKAQQDAAKAALAERRKSWTYTSQPYTVSWCDSEKGWSECACGAIWHYKSACSTPRELYQDRCTGDVHSIVYGEVFADCHCGGMDPFIEHPCIGHDRATGEPFLGPSWFIDPTDKQANWSAGR